MIRRREELATFDSLSDLSVEGYVPEGEADPLIMEIPLGGREGLLGFISDSEEDPWGEGREGGGALTARSLDGGMATRQLDQ